jgi:hypothetical protein
MTCQRARRDALRYWHTSYINKCLARAQPSHAFPAATAEVLLRYTHWQRGQETFGNSRYSPRAQFASSANTCKGGRSRAATEVRITAYLYEVRSRWHHPCMTWLQTAIKALSDWIHDIGLGLLGRRAEDSLDEFLTQWFGFRRRRNKNGRRRSISKKRLRPGTSKPRRLMSRRPVRKGE